MNKAELVEELKKIGLQPGMDIEVSERYRSQSIAYGSECMECPRYGIAP